MLTDGMKIDPERVKTGIRERLAEIVGADGVDLDVNYRVDVGRVASTILDVATSFGFGPDCAGSSAFSGSARPVCVAGRLRIGLRRDPAQC